MSIALIQSSYYSTLLASVSALTKRRQEERAAENSAAAESADSVTLSDTGRALAAGEEVADTEEAGNETETFNGMALLIAAQKRAIYENKKIKDTEPVEMMCKLLGLTDDSRQGGRKEAGWRVWESLLSGEGGGQVGGQVSAQG